MQSAEGKPLLGTPKMTFSHQSGHCPNQVAGRTQVPADQVYGGHGY
jgi:hypothetical protein